MSYSASLIAYAFVKKGIDENNPVTQMKLQKLVYFAHGIHLANHDEPLIKENFQAWKFGPVVPKIYNDYKLYGSSPIIDTELLFFFSGLTEDKLDTILLDSNANDSINITWESLKDSSASQLSNWTHKEDSPWHHNYQEGVNDVIIPNEQIKEYFVHTFKKNDQ